MTTSKPLLTSSCAAAALTMGHRLAKERADYEARTGGVLRYAPLNRDYTPPPQIRLADGRTAHVVVETYVDFPLREGALHVTLTR